MSASQTGVLAAAVLADPPEGLVRLGSVDALIVTLYFAMVIGIGFYLKRYATTGEEFFLAGRDMSSWIAGLSFVAANLGALELMGWASARKGSPHRVSRASEYLFESAGDGEGNVLPPGLCAT